MTKLQCIPVLVHLTVLSGILRTSTGTPYGTKGSLGKGMLFPRDSESRQTKLLNGIWNFKADTSPYQDEGFENTWYDQPLYKTGDVISMPVPSSFNDITEHRWLRDFVGWVWYDRQFYVPSAWSLMNKDRRVVLRFESVHYYCKVWLNGNQVMSHEGGHLPFEADITHALDYGGPNRLTVAVNNTLSRHTIPPGETKIENDIEVTQEYSFDFFNYAGIHRSVILYTTPSVFLSDITIATDYLFDSGIVKFEAEVGASDDVTRRDITMLYELTDKEGRLVASVGGTQLFGGELRVRRPRLWWPVGMGYQPGYLYTLKVTTVTETSSDVYRLPVGIRSVKVLRTRFLINDAPFYFKGFGKHEDSDGWRCMINQNYQFPQMKILWQLHDYTSHPRQLDIHNELSLYFRWKSRQCDRCIQFRGRGFDYPILVKDFNLLKWFGANSFRTSHYPYSEETMNLADELGFVVIDESPAVGFSKLDYFNNRTLDRHLDVMSELIRRDKNHPSVVMWSVANEPQSQYEHVAEHLRKVIGWTKEEDYQRRPVTFVTFMNPQESEKEDTAVKYCDVISFNRYYGWYTYPGKLNQISGVLEREMRQWYERHRKPVMITEYGTEALAGLHRDKSVMYTEEYQVEVMKHYFPVFDSLRWEFLIGEMIWSFADFATPQDIKRIAGENRKGVLTRQRQPKASAHALRSRYQSITLHHCHRCTGDELFDYLLRYKLTKRHSHLTEKPTPRLPALIREERVNTTIDR